MRAVQLRAYDGNPESIAVVELPVPRPGPGQVLVRRFANQSIGPDVHPRSLWLQETSSRDSRF